MDDGGPMAAVAITSRTPNEWQQILQAKENKILELEQMIHSRDVEISELRSHLDKFQSVFPFHLNAQKQKVIAGLNNNAVVLRPRKQRAQGISAEPQSDATIQELSQQTFPTYDKNDK